MKNLVLLFLCSAAFGCRSVADRNPSATQTGDAYDAYDAGAYDAGAPDPDSGDPGGGGVGVGDDDGNAAALDGDGDRDSAEPGDAEDSEPVVTTGSWIYTDEDFEYFQVLEDPCGWAPLLEGVSEFGLFDFMPTHFEVVGDPDTFTMLAQRHGSTFGADDPVMCTMIDSRQFTCSTQSVRPIDGLLGSYGWRYTVDFSGEVVDQERMLGVAEVHFQAIDPTTAYRFDAAGIDFRDCAQVVRIDLAYTPKTLGWDDWLN